MRELAPTCSCRSSILVFFTFCTRSQECCDTNNTNIHRAPSVWHIWHLRGTEGENWDKENKASTDVLQPERESRQEVCWEVSRTFSFTAPVCLPPLCAWLSSTFCSQSWTTSEPWVPNTPLILIRNTKHFTHRSESTDWTVSVICTLQCKRFKC